MICIDLNADLHGGKSGFEKKVDFYIINSQSIAFILYNANEMTSTGKISYDTKITFIYIIFIMHLSILDAINNCHAKKY